MHYNNIDRNEYALILKKIHNKIQLEKHCKNEHIERRVDGRDFVQETFALLKQNYPYISYSLVPYSSNIEVFSQEECDEIIKLGYDKGVEFSNYSSIFNNKINYILPGSNSDFIYDRLRNIVAELNQNIWKFQIYDFGEPLKFTEYDASFGGYSSLHMDLGYTTETNYRKLTIIVQLSEDSSYEGGDFIVQYLDGIYAMPRKRGSIIVFPSFLHHKVEPVTRGVRNSLVIFAYGPPFS